MAVAVSKLNGVEGECVVTHIKVWNDVFSCDEDTDAGVAQDFVTEAGMKDVVGVAVFCDLQIVMFLDKGQDRFNDFRLFSGIDDGNAFAWLCHG